MEDRIVDRSRVDHEELWALTALLFLIIVTAAWWMLALWPATDTAPSWLARTQAVCFGTLDNGMPDAAGWTGLIASPLGMLVLLLVAARRPLSRLASRVRTEPWLQAVAALTFVAAATGSAAAATRVRYAYNDSAEALISSAYGSAVKLKRDAPPLSLIDQTGQRRDLKSLAGRPVIVTFAYAHCETICPALVHNAIVAQAELRASQHAVALMIVTLDPARDTPARLRTMAAQWKFGADAYVLSGSTPEVQQALDDWNVSRAYNATNGDVTHPAIAYIIGRTGRMVYEVSAPTSDHLVRLIRDL